jgi:hypothetical protein
MRLTPLRVFGIALAGAAIWCGSLTAAPLSAPPGQKQQPLPPLKPYKGPKLDDTGAVPSAAFESEQFVIACWVPSMYDLDKWAKRGINVAWFNQRINPKEKPLQEYVWKAQAAGLKMWRYPAEYMDPPLDPSFDDKDPTLVAYSLLDEPILHKKSPEDMKDQALDFRKANPKLKLILNLEGDKFVMPDPGPGVVGPHTEYMEACDIGFVDWYVKNRNADRYPLSHLWTAVERLVVWGKTKPVGAFIECSNQKIAPEGREPTVGEMRAQVAGSIIHGARLIAYFPQVPGKRENKGKYFGTGNDGTPPELEAEMIKINKQLQALAPILHARGGRLTTLPEPMIGAVRFYKGTTYLIVLNNDDEETTTFNGEQIEPYDWRVYTAGPAPAEKD